MFMIMVVVCMFGSFLKDLMFGLCVVFIVVDEVCIFGMVNLFC